MKPTGHSLRVVCIVDLAVVWKRVVGRMSQSEIAKFC